MRKLVVFAALAVVSTRAYAESIAEGELNPSWVQSIGKRAAAFSPSAARGFERTFKLAGKPDAQVNATRSSLTVNQWSKDGESGLLRQVQRSISVSRLSVTTRVAYRPVHTLFDEHESFETTRTERKLPLGVRETVTTYRHRNDATQTDTSKRERLFHFGNKTIKLSSR
jgi:hypothetical protein